MEERILKADVVYRRKLFIVYGIALVCCALFLKWAFIAIPEYFSGANLKERIMASEFILILLLLLFIGPSIYLIYIGRQIKRSGEFPFPGMKVIRDTKVIVGEKALNRGRMFTILGYSSIILSISGSIRIHFTLTKLMNFMMNFGR